MSWLRHRWTRHDVAVLTYLQVGILFLTADAKAVGPAGAVAQMLIFYAAITTVAYFAFRREATDKGYSPRWGVLCLFPLLGAIMLWSLPVRTPADTPHRYERLRASPEPRRGGIV